MANHITSNEAMFKICEKLSEVYNGYFPCICGENPTIIFTSGEEKKLEEILACLDLLKESVK